MDYFKVPYTAYVILIICVVIISFLKLLLSNKLILHTLHKKNYGGNFSDYVLWIWYHFAGNKTSRIMQMNQSTAVVEYVRLAAQCR